MKTEVSVFFYGHHIPGGAAAVLVPARCGPDVAKVTDRSALHAVDVWVTLDEPDERLPILFGLLERYGETPLIRRRDRFTDEELEAAPLLVMSYDVNARIFGGPRMGTTYDMSNACERCGAGARQTSAMIIEGADLHKLEGRRAAMTPYDDVLVDGTLAGVLAESGATGISFRGVFAAFEKRGHIQLPWRQLCATHTMPPMSPRSTGIVPDDLCACKKSGFDTPSEIPLRLGYRASDLAELHDVNVTWEWFGYARFNGDVSDSVLAYPWFLVTPKIWRIFQGAGVTGFDWIPIRVEEG